MHVIRMFLFFLILSSSLIPVSLAAQPQTLDRLNCGDGQVPTFEQASSAWICGDVNRPKMLEVFDVNDQQVGRYIQDDLVVLSQDGFEFVVRVKERPSSSEDSVVNGFHPSVLSPFNREIFFTTSDCTGTPYIARHAFLGLVYALQAIDPADQQKHTWVPLTPNAQPMMVTVQSEIIINPFLTPPVQCLADTAPKEVVQASRLGTDLNQVFTSPLRLVVSGGNLTN